MKINRYYELTNKFITNNYTVRYYAVEVGAISTPAKSLFTLLKDLGLPVGAISSALAWVYNVFGTYLVMPKPTHVKRCI
jgi:hypothetical protein